MILKWETVGSHERNLSDATLVQFLEYLFAYPSVCYCIATKWLKLATHNFLWLLTGPQNVYKKQNTFFNILQLFKFLEKGLIYNVSIILNSRYLKWIFIILVLLAEYPLVIFFPIIPFFLGFFWPPESFCSTSLALSNYCNKNLDF